MRINKIFSALMVATTIGATALVAPATTAQAKQSTTSLKTFPKSIRGTWYHYEENDGYYYKTMAFSAKKLTVKNYFDSFGIKKTKATNNLHSVKNPASFTEGFSNKKSSWVSAKAGKHGYTQVYAYGFLVTEGSGSYKTLHKTYKGKSVKVLYNQTRKDHFYQTKAQAKFFNPVGAQHK